MKKRILLVAIICLLVIPLFAGGSSEKSGEEGGAEKFVKIGVLASLTGTVSVAEGVELVNGVQMAIDELNAAGGIAGYKFKMVTGDVQNSTADVVATVVERFFGDRDVVGVICNQAAPSNFEIEMMAEQDMPYIIGSNSQQTKDIISPDPGKYMTVWSTAPIYDAYNTELVPVVKGLVDEGLLRLPNKKIAIITPDDAGYCQGIAEGLAKSFTADGWQVSNYDIIPFGEVNDFRGFLGKVRANPPAIVVNTDYQVGNEATFMLQFLENPTNSLLFIQYAPSVPEFVDLTKGKSTGVIYSLLGGILDTPSNPRAAELLKRYKDKYGVETGMQGVAGYERMMLYADALRKVGDPYDRLAVGKAIGQIDKQTAMGRLYFDQTTHLAVQGNDAIPIQFFQIQDGKRILFYPSQYADGKFIQPPWMK